MKKQAPSLLALNLQRWASVFSICGVSLLPVGCTPQSKTPESDAPKVETTPNPPKPSAAQTSQAADAQEVAIDESLDINALMEARLPEESLKQGWIRLFDGQSLMGWEPTSNANWRVEDGAIVVDSGDQGFLATKCRFADFELTLEYKASAKTNSGVFLRSPSNPTSPAKDCYELNIAPIDNPFPTGSFVERQKVEPTKIGELNPDEWHTLHVHVDREHIQSWVDAKEAADFLDESKLVNGKILLQFREGPVAFRNIRLRPIGYSLIPTASLEGWLPSDEKAFKFTRTEEGFIQLEGGRADLELLQQVQNACVQFSVQTLADNTNSGLFFRCIPGSVMDGYECQVNHAFDADRRLPKDHGTGAIFRRAKARAVLSDDHQDAYVTINMDGPQIATWVQGVQVVDWKDDRQANENPRLGYREQAGTLQLQAHDPACKVMFKSLLISPTDVVAP